MIYKLKYGLGGGFGGAREYEVVEVEKPHEADKLAYECACEEYDNYVGMYGLRSVEEIMEEDELEEDEACEQFDEEREEWLEWDIEPCDKDCENCDAFDVCIFHGVVMNERR